MIGLMNNAQPFSNLMILKNFIPQINLNDHQRLLIVHFLPLKFLKLGTQVQKTQTCTRLQISSTLFLIIPIFQYFVLLYLFLLHPL